MLDPANPGIIRISPSPGQPSQPRPFGITKGPDGQGDQVLWFTDLANNALGKVTTAGTITEFPLRGRSIR